MLASQMCWSKTQPKFAPFVISAIVKSNTQLCSQQWQIFVHAPYLDILEFALWICTDLEGSCQKQENGSVAIERKMLLAFDRERSVWDCNTKKWAISGYLINWNDSIHGNRNKNSS